MQEIPTTNKNTRLDNKGKHVGGSIGKKENIIMDAPKLDKRGMSTADYR